MGPPTWAQIGVFLLATLGFIIAVFRILVGGWIRRRERVEADLTIAIASLSAKHTADVEGLRSTFFEEIKVIRETWHQQNQQTGLVIGRLGNQVDTLQVAVGKIQDDHEKLSAIIQNLDRTVAVLTDRLSARRTDHHHKADGGVE